MSGKPVTSKPVYGYLMDEEMCIRDRPCSGYGGSWRKIAMSKLLPYETIVKAHEGDPDAIDTLSLIHI